MALLAKARKGSLALLGGACALLAPWGAAPAWAQSLFDAVQQALETNPVVLSAARNQQAADAAVGVARGGYLPRLDVLLGEGRERSRNVATAGRSQDWVSLNRHEELVVLNQMLWDGLGTKSEVERRQAFAESAAHRFRATAEEVAMQAIDAYLEVLRSRELLAYASDNLNAHEAANRQVRLRGDGGDGWRAELEQMETRLALARSNVASAHAALRDAETAFRRVVGEAPAHLSDPGRDAIALPQTLAAAIEIALDQQPLIKSAEADIEAAQAQRSSVRSAFSPRVELELSASNHENLDGLPFQDRDRMAMLRLRWNLFRGGADKARLAEAAEQIGEASENAGRTRRQVEAAVRLAYSAHEAASERLPLLEQYVAWSDKTRRAYGEQFLTGKQTLVNLLNSENEYFSARSAYVNAYFSEVSSRYRLLSAMGSLLAAMGIAVPEGTTGRPD